MQSCETCKFRANFDPKRHREARTPRNVLKVTDAIAKGIETQLSQCTGWSRQKFIFGSIADALNLQPLNAAPAWEDVCNNPFRATNEFWKLRGELHEASTGHAQGEIAGTFVGIPNSEMVKMMIESTQHRTTERINGLQAKINGV